MLGMTKFQFVTEVAIGEKVAVGLKMVAQDQLILQVKADMTQFMATMVLVAEQIIIVLVKKLQVLHVVALTLEPAVLLAVAVVRHLLGGQMAGAGLVLDLVVAEVLQRYFTTVNTLMLKNG